MFRSNNKPKSIRKLINDVADHFAESDIYYGHGTDNAMGEAFYLVLAALDLPFDLTNAQLNQTVDPEASSSVWKLAIRRVDDRIPVAYLVNKAWFAGMPFYVNENVLIPRSPIAELIEEKFRPWIQPDTVKNILDIGTGGACIAIACAVAFSQSRVDAVDISPAALDVAQKNVEAYRLGKRVKLIESDLYAALGDQKYDLIIANPPYVDAKDMRALPAEYRHEPRLALAAGDDGLDIVRRIIKNSGKHMNKEAVLIVEVGNSQPAMESAFPDLPLTWLEFERGGEGVFLLTAEDLAGY